MVMMGFSMCGELLAVCVPVRIFVSADYMSSYVNMSLQADREGFLAYITPRIVHRLGMGAKTLLVSKSKNTVTLKTSDLSPRLAPSLQQHASVQHSTYPGGSRGEPERGIAYRPSAPPQGLESWRLSHWSSCFSPHMCSSLHLRLQL